MDNEEKQGVYVVLGGSGGIGSEVARQLTAAGDTVVLAARPSEHLNQLASELSAVSMEIDATQFSDVESVFTAAREQYGRVDGAVNCVGSVLLKPAQMTSEADWSDTIATNLTSAFATTRAAAKTMKSGGSVVLMSSAAAQIGLANHEAIAAAKAGVIGLARSAAATYAARPIRFNVVAPGLVKTKLTRRIWDNERSAAASQAMHALGRLGEPAEVASLVTWLLQPTGTWITGQVFSVDGGLSGVKLAPRQQT